MGTCAVSYPGALDRGRVSCGQEVAAIALERNHAGRIERGHLAPVVVVNDDVRVGRVAIDRNVGVSAADDRCAAGKQRTCGKTDERMR